MSQGVIVCGSDGISAWSDCGPIVDVAKHYQQFLAKKSIVPSISGLAEVPALHESLFSHQRDVCAWALRLGKAGRQCGKVAQVGCEHCPRHVFIVAHEAEQEILKNLQKKEALQAKIDKVGHR